MKVAKTKKTIACDMLGCSNLAEFSIKNEETISDNSLYVCKTCAKNLYLELGKHFNALEGKNVKK